MQSNNLSAPTLNVRHAINLPIPSRRRRINTSVPRLWMFEALYQKQAYILTLSTSAIRFWMFGPLYSSPYHTKHNNVHLSAPALSVRGTACSYIEFIILNVGAYGTIETRHVRTCIFSIEGTIVVQFWVTADRLPLCKIINFTATQLIVLCCAR